jgi:hypothetical protein
MTSRAREKRNAVANKLKIGQRDRLGCVDAADQKRQKHIISESQQKKRNRQKRQEWRQQHPLIRSWRAEKAT